MSVGGRQFGGMKCEEAKRLKELEDENKRLKQLVADLSLDNQMLKHVNSKNCRVSSYSLRSRAVLESDLLCSSFKLNLWFLNEELVRSWISLAARSVMSLSQEMMKRLWCRRCWSWFVGVLDLVIAGSIVCCVVTAGR